MNNDPDIFGQAIKDYFEGRPEGTLVVHSAIAEDDEIPLSHLFRTLDNMPALEQKALSLAKGKILDVGCGAGAHATHLAAQGFSVTAIDTSAGAVAVCNKRGLQQVHQASLLNFGQSGYDTIYLLMNGSGIFESLSRLPEYLRHLKSLLAPGGQVLLDSSDIHYMFDSPEGREALEEIDTYYGEVDFQISYGGEISAPFQWLYVDFDTLSLYAESEDFDCEKIMDGPHYDYLARLTPRTSKN